MLVVGTYRLFSTFPPHTFNKYILNYQSKMPKLFHNRTSSLLLWPKTCSHLNILKNNIFFNGLNWSRIFLENIYDFFKETRYQKICYHHFATDVLVIHYLTILSTSRIPSFISGHILRCICDWSPYKPQ